MYSNRKIAKIKFFAAYTFSVLAILALFSFFVKPLGGAGAALGFGGSGADVHAVIYDRLHQKMERLNQVSTVVANNKTPENLASLEAEQALFYRGIDSVRQSIATLPNTGREKELRALLEAFYLAGEKQVSLARGKTATGVSSSSGDLQQALRVSERRLADLEKQNLALQQEKENALALLAKASSGIAPAAQQPTGSSDQVWKNRYEEMKAANEKLRSASAKSNAQITELKKSYKDVVDDNRRLLTQLQAARAGRN